MPKDKYKPRSISMPDKMYEVLKKIAEEEDTSVSNVGRTFIAEGIIDRQIKK